MYKIGELSRLCRIPVKTLRYYDSEGLLPPDEIDRFSGYRYYSASKLRDCYHILALKELSFSLDEIRQHLHADTKEELLSLIESKASELSAKRDTIEAQLSQLNTITQLLAKGELPMFDIVIRNNDRIRAAARRDIYASKQEAKNEFAKIKRALPEKLCGSRTILINYETEYRETDLDLAACVEITGPLPKNCGYTETTIAFSGDVASVICGAKELDDAYRALLMHLCEKNYQLTGAACELYYDDGTVELKLPVCKRTICEDVPLADETFENDPEAVGKWKLLDAVVSRDQFVYGSPKLSDSENGAFRELYFLENGMPYWIFEGWTKGRLFRSAKFPIRHKVAERYTIETVDGHTLLFLETKQRYVDGTMDAAPTFYIYEKLSHASFQANDIRICDNTDAPFAPDPEVLGKWLVFDFYNKEIENFDPSVRHRNPDGLFLLSVEFFEGGRCVYTTKNGSDELAWTRGLVLNRHNRTAPAYRIVNRGGTDYLILEWKSGDYSFGGLLRWYVLQH